VLFPLRPSVGRVLATLPGRSPAGRIPRAGRHASRCLGPHRCACAGGDVRPSVGTPDTMAAMVVPRARTPRRPGAGLAWPRTPREFIPWLGLPTAGVAAGVAMIVAALLPWYGTNLGSPFTPSTTSGW